MSDKEIYIPYIKPTRFKHDSGYRTFEVGYCRCKDGKAVDIYILGKFSDHIWLHNNYDLYHQQPGLAEDRFNAPNLNMDLTLNGYIRLWCMDKKDMFLRWEYDDCIVSTATLCMMKEPFIPKEKNKTPGGLDV